MREVGERSGGAMRMSPGTLYGSIQRMRQDGLIVEMRDRVDPTRCEERRRYYGLTSFGQLVLQAEAERLEQLVERGELTPAEARAHPQRNLIYRALGLPDTEVDLFVEPVQDGDTIVLCSDGLCSVLEDEEIGAILRSTQPENSVECLIACANARGGPDNISAIVAFVSGCAAG